FINSMLAQYDDKGFLPIWQLWSDETHCMIANHAVPVVVDAVLKEIKGIDKEKSYKAVKASVLKDHLFSPFSVLEKYEYLPYDLQSQSVSMTLEMSYDDWCVAQLARKLGKNDDFNYFIKRAAFYKNLFDKKTEFFRAKSTSGEWITPFDPLHYSGNGKEAYTEANAWQYLWSVQHDVDGLATLLGGKRGLSRKLDDFFSISHIPEKVNHNASGFIGQYAHGNEPSHHVSYLYNYSSEPWKSQYYISKIMRDMYNTSSSGYSGNEDCGQMSAWYIFSAMGFYPVNPSSSVYVFGTPAFKNVVIKLSNGKSLTISAENVSEKNIYIQNVKYNGGKYERQYITHSMIMQGGSLEFDMGPKPNKRWGISAQSKPLKHAY
ncbi:MAG: glycoside hydrolase family 92 protein, partial [Niabella sp.]